MKAYKVKLKPSPRVSRILESWLETCRDLYNSALAERRAAYRTSKTSIRYADQSKQLPEIKAVREDVAAVNAQVLQDTLRRLDKAFAAFFRRVRAGLKPGFPRFRGKGRYMSFTCPQAKGAFRLQGRHLYLSKIGRVKVYGARSVEGRAKTCTIKREADGWYAIVVVDEDRCRVIARATPRVTMGVDLGIEHFLTLSTGEPVDNPRLLKQAEARVTRAQRSMDRKKLGGKNRAKAATRLAREHQRVARQRRDFHEKTSLELVKRYDGCVFEDLNIAGLMKNHHLAKAIADVGWNSFLQIHFAKAASAGRSAKKVPAAFTSTDCSKCGARVRKTLSQRMHRCIECGLTISRDHNAAINILARAGPVGMGDGAQKNHEPPSRPTRNHPPHRRKAVGG